MAKDQHPDFSTPKGYLLPEITQRGIRDGTSAPAGYKDAAISLDELTSDALTGGWIDQRNLNDPEPSAPPAKFYTRGFVKTTSVPKTSIPRISDVTAHRGRSIFHWYGAIGAPAGQSTLAHTLGSLGTVSSVDSAANGYGANFASGGGGGSAGAYTATASINGGKLRNYPYLTAKFATGSDLSLQFIWVACASGVLLTLNPAGVTIWGLLYSSATGATWQLATRAAADAAVTLTDTGIPVIASTLYTTECWYDGVNINAVINGTPFATGLGSLPTSEAANTITMVLTTVGAVNRNWDVYSLYYEQD